MERAFWERVSGKESLRRMFRFCPFRDKLLSWERTRLILGNWSIKSRNKRSRFECWMRRRRTKRRTLRSRGSRLLVNWPLLRLRLLLSRERLRNWRISTARGFLTWSSYLGRYRRRRLRRKRPYKDLRIWRSRWTSWIDSKARLRDKKRKWRMRRKLSHFR